MKPTTREKQLADESRRSLEQNARLESELAEVKGFLEAIMEHIPEAITVTDARDLSIRMVSKFGRELLGHPNEQIEGLTYEEYTGFQDILHADGMTRPSWEELPLTRAILKGEIITNEEWALRRSDGEKAQPSLQFRSYPGPEWQRNSRDCPLARHHRAQTHRRGTPHQRISWHAKIWSRNCRQNPIVSRKSTPH